MVRHIPFLDKFPIAHRGFYNEEYPENSMGAFVNALKNNYAIELDLQLSKDNEIMVFHDDSLTKMTGKDLGIKDYLKDELIKTKLLNTTYTIPMFKEVLSLVNGKVPLIIELKSISEKNELLPKLVYEAIKDYKGEYVIQSFDPFLVAYFAKNHKEIYRGQLVDNLSDSKLSKIKIFLLSNLLLNVFSKPDYINSNFNHLPKNLINFKKRGGQIICYTARNEIEYKNAFNIFDNVIFEHFTPSYFFEHIKHNNKK